MKTDKPARVPVPMMSPRALAYTTATSVAAAVVILVCVVFPAEYHYDPTGVGQRLGLTALGKVSQSVAAPVAPWESSDLLAEGSLDAKAQIQRKTVRLSLPPLGELEYKLTMNQYDEVEYQWNSQSIPLYFDLHGEPEGDTTGYFKSYALATGAAMKGSFMAPFKGSHGWYFKNNTSHTVEVSLTLVGRFSEAKLLP